MNKTDKIEKVIYSVIVLGLLAGAFMVGNSYAWIKANRKIEVLEVEIEVLKEILESEKRKESKVKSVFAKGLKFGKKGLKEGFKYGRQGAQESYKYTRKGAGWIKDFSVSAGRFMADLPDKTYDKTADYMDNDITRRIREASSPEELKALAEEMKKILDSDAVRESVKVLEDASKKCIESEKCKNLGTTAIYGGAGSIVGSGLIAVSGMTAVGMVGGGAGVGASAGPVGAIVGATVGLAVYGIVKAFEDREKELIEKGDAYLRDLRKYARE